MNPVVHTESKSYAQACVVCQLPAFPQSRIFSLDSKSSSSSGRHLTPVLLRLLDLLMNAAAAAPAAIVAGQAAVAVLTNSVLWRLVTDFMTGYPFKVLQFYQEERNKSYLGRYGDRRVGNLHRGGVFFHLALAADSMEMLKLLFKLVTKVQYSHDPKLRVAKLQRCAVLYNRVGALELIVREIKASHQGFKWEPHLMRIALERKNPDVRMLQWLYAHVPQESYPLLARDMDLHVKYGDLEVVQWLHEHQCLVSQSVVDDAAKRGHLSVLQYFYEHTAVYCTRVAVVCAAEKGDLDIVKLVVLESGSEDVAEAAVNAAAAHNRLALVKFLLFESPNALVAPRVIDFAASNGHLEMVEYLHVHWPRGCTDKAMSGAAASGHVNVVKFLHENRSEGCAVDGLDGAAHNGHLELVKFLFDNYALSCSPDVMDEAARKGHLAVLEFVHRFCSPTRCSTLAMNGAALAGHLEVVKFLHFDRTEGCTVDALNFASSQGHSEIARFLLENRTEGGICFAMVEAAYYGHLAAVKLLHGHLRAGDSVYPAVVAAVKKSHHPIVKFLCENQQHERTSILQQAMVKQASHVVIAARKYATLEDQEASK